MPLLVWKGLDEPTAAFFVGLTALSTVIVRPLTGWLGDRQSKQKIGAMGVLLGAVGLVVLAYSDGALWPLVVFAILFAFGDGINSVTWALVATARVGAIRGRIACDRDAVAASSCARTMAAAAHAGRSRP